MALKPSTEPVVYASAAQALLGALVTAGWLTIPSDEVNSLATVAGLIIATVVGIIARRSVKPVAKINAVAQVTTDLLASNPAAATQHDPDPVATVPTEPPEDPPAHAG